MLVCASFCATCTRDRGCSAHTAFPAPSFREGQCLCKTSGASRRENAEMRLFSSLKIQSRNLRQQRLHNLRRHPEARAERAKDGMGHGLCPSFEARKGAHLRMTPQRQRSATANPPLPNLYWTPPPMPGSPVRTMARPNGPIAPERTECRIFAVQQNSQKAPAKGAMVFRPASLYWCGWHTRFGAGGSLAPKKMRGRKHA